MPQFLWSARFAAALFVILALATPAWAEVSEADAEADAPEDCELSEITGGVGCLDASGELIWDIVHPALWESREAFDTGEPPLREIELHPLGSRHFYFVGSDLLEVEGGLDGEVIRRVRFPAEIIGLSADNEEDFEVTLRVRFEQDLHEEVALPYRPGDPAPSQTFWGNPVPQLYVQRDANWLGYRLRDEEPMVAAQILRQVHRRDPTNPFLAFYAAQSHLEEERQEAAHQILAAAIHDGVHWSDLFYFTGELEQIAQHDLAEQAFQTGRQQMERLGIEPRRLLSLVLMVVTMPPMEALRGEKSPLDQALDDGDVDLVHEVQMRRALIFPYVEGGDQAWFALSQWMADQGEDELAAQWQERAQANREVNDFLMTRSVRLTDRGILASAAITLALFLMSLLVGIRGGLARREQFDADGENVDSFLTPPKLRIRDGLGIALLFAVLCALPYLINAQVEFIGEVAYMPVTVSADSLASPEFREWIEEMAPSPARDELVAQANREFELLQRRESIDEKGPVFQLIGEAISHEVNQRQWEHLRSLQMPDIFSTAASLDLDGAEVTTNTFSLFRILFALIPLTALVLLGAVVGFASPRAGRWMLRAIPGGPPILAPLGALLLAVFIAALLALVGVDSILQDLSAPSFQQYFGLGSLDYTSPQMPRIWILPAVAIVLATHVAAVLWTVRSDPQ